MTRHKTLRWINWKNRNWPGYYKHDLKSMKFLCLSGNTTATNRSRLIATICNTEVAQERYVKMKYARDRLALQSYKNVLWMINSIKSGSHIKVTITSAIAKLNRRLLEARRRWEFVAMAKQTSKFPSDPKTQRYRWLWSAQYHEP